MTDKQIMIDDCIFLDEWKHCDICEKLIKTKDGANNKKREHILTEEDLRCDFYPNCYYKQLKRKEQECEKLKKKLKPKLKNAHCVYFDGQTGWCKAKEFIRCNPIGCKLYTIDELSTIVDLQQQLDQLKQTLTEIKEIAMGIMDDDLEDSSAYYDAKQILQIIDEVK